MKKNEDRTCRVSTKQVMAEIGVELSEQQLKTVVGGLNFTKITYQNATQR